MTTLVLTLVGDDRSGIVAAVAAAVDRAGGNWEDSELAELAGAFAGIVQVSVPADRADALRAELAGIEGLATVAVPASAPATDATARRVTVEILGNDHPGIVRDISAALHAQGLSIARMATETRDAAMAGGRLFEAAISAVASGMAGGRLFEAAISAVASGTADLDAVRTDLERLAAEIQVDITVH